MTGFLTNVDIGNRGLAWCGQYKITTFGDNSRAAVEVSLCYDKLRVAELRKLPWRFGTRRAYIWPWTLTSVIPIFPAWSASSVSYAPMQIVVDTSGIFWSCLIPHTSSVLNAP